MSDVDWPERKAFMTHLDELKERADIRYDSSLAAAAGIAETLVEHWRAGRRKPSLLTVSRVAEALGESPAVLAKLAGLPPVAPAPNWSSGPQSR